MPPGGPRFQPTPPDPCNIADPGLPKAAVCSRSNCLFEKLWCRPSSWQPPPPFMTSSLLLRPLESEILVQETAVPHAFRRLLLGRPAGRTWPAVCISHPRGWVLVLYRLSGMGWEDLWAAGRRDFTEDEMLVVRSSLRTTKVPEPKCRGISPRRPETTVLHVSYCKVLTGLSGARGDTPVGSLARFLLRGHAATRDNLASYRS